MVVVFVEEEESKSNFVFWLWNVSYNTKMSVEYLLLVALVQEVCKIPCKPCSNHSIIRLFERGWGQAYLGFSSEEGGRHTWVTTCTKTNFSTKKIVTPIIKQ